MNPTRALTLFLALALFGFVLLALSTPAARAADPVIVRVTTGGTATWPCGDQSNWSNPCALQTALTRSVAPAELWVAAGTYKPTTGTDRSATFQLRDGIALYGGFAGGETLRSQRNFTSNVTILSGDLKGDDNSNVRYDEPTRAENSYHVVTGSGVTNTAVLDGFRVTGGNSNEYSDPNGSGGGIYNNGAYLTIHNVTFISNTASGNGGGMYNYQSSPTVSNVAFTNNAVNFFGGGMYNEASNSTLTNVTFIGNSATDGGGMDSSYYSNPTLSNVTFISNSSSDGGGGMSNSDSSPSLSNVTFISNTASSRGGGMYNRYNSSPTLTDVTFSGNSVPDSTGYGGGMYNDACNSTLTNVTFSSNSAWIGGGMQDHLSNSTLNNVTFISNTATGTGAFGGMATGGGSAILTNVTFSGNVGGWYGGGLGIDSNAMTLTNVTFSGNSAGIYGGGVINYEGSPTLINVTFSGNTAGQHSGGMYSRNSSSPTIRNAIFWGNTAPSKSQIGNDDTSTSSLSDSVVQGGYISGTHIITADPHLGTLGNYGGSSQTIPLLSGSSAIDAGNDAICPATDQRGISRPQGTHCDIGAFELEFARLNLPLLRK